MRRLMLLCLVPFACSSGSDAAVGPVCLSGPCEHPATDAWQAQDASSDSGDGLAVPEDMRDVAAHEALAPDVLPDVRPETGQDAPGPGDVPSDSEPPAPTTGKACDDDSACTNPPAKCVDWAVDSDGVTHRLCSGNCAGTCPEAMLCMPTNKAETGFDRMCFPFPRGLCAPCTVATDCPEAGGQCLKMTGGSFCSSPCIEGTCPTGFQCINVENPGVPPAFREQCIPLVGTCACVTEVAGQQFPVSIDEGGHSCSCQLTCDLDAGWRCKDSACCEKHCPDGFCGDNGCGGTCACPG